MPRAVQKINARFLNLLRELRDEHDNDDHRYMVYNKAWNGLKKETREFTTPRDLLAVHGIGPAIVKKIEQRYIPDWDPDIPPPSSKPRGRQLKRSASDIGAETPRANKRRTGTVAELPTQAPLVQPVPPTIEATTAASVGKPFQFWYLDVEGNRVRDRVNAKTSFFTVGMNELLQMKIVYPLSQATHPLTAALLNTERRGADMVVADIPEDLAEQFPQCPGFADVPNPARRRPNLSTLLAEEGGQQNRPRNSIDPSRQLPGYLQTGATAVASGSRGNTSSSSQSHDRLPSDMRLAATARSFKSISQAESGAISSPVALPRPLVRAVTTPAVFSTSASALHRTASLPVPSQTTRPRLSHAIPAPPPIEHHSLCIPQANFPEFTPRILRAGEYAVQLLMDHRERVGKYRGDIHEQLGSSVSVGTAALELGDVVWVAIIGEEKFVLDVVLERKRLDDLVGSIINKNSRFHEQKFRLHQSGISRVLYLVEAYDTQRNRENWDPQIKTALSSTQVVDGFFVKETENLQDTIAYLTGLTEELCRDHQRRNLYVIPSHLIKRHSYLDLIKHLRRTYPDRRYVTSFADYQALNSKSGFTTVRDTWARMLLCVRGMSAEKVRAVVDRWPTPRALWEAFLEAEAEEAAARARQEAEAEIMATGPSKGKGRKKSTVPEARKMLIGVGGESGVRAIGPVLSSKLYDQFMAASFEEDG
ncbi:ERCC4 domain-containing protein [Mycena pura]|uniref:Crossover junction endonuclease MUS81 n=1 Tax=Mycena pura TaxID=153505 RepID=A0AAD6V3T2_9AGAR|nr:ERCC4 domain-containing protein [Mycena pura]